MTALAFDFDYGDEGVEPAPKPARRLYAVCGTVDAPAADAPASLDAALAPAVRASAPRLDLLLGGAVTTLRRSAGVACPMCDDGTMVPRWSAASGVVGGRCSDCGTTLE